MDIEDIVLIIDDQVDDKRPVLSIALIHEIFQYIDSNFKLLIYRDDSTDEERSKDYDRVV